MEKNTFDLGAGEAALIFKEDMSVDVILPKMDDTETVDMENNQNMFVAMAIAASTDNPMFRHVISNKLDEMLNPEDTGAGCGGCGGCGPEIVDVVPEEVAEEVPKCTCGPEDCSCEDC